MEDKIQSLAQSIAKMQPREIQNLVADLAKATKKKKLTSGNLFFKDYCKEIAKFAVTKETAKEVLIKHNLAA